MAFPPDEGIRSWSRPHEFVAKAQLLNELCRFRVRSEEMVVKLLQIGGTKLKARGESPWRGFTLKQDYVLTPLGEPQSHGQPERPSPQDAIKGQEDPRSRKFATL